MSAARTTRRGRQRAWYVYDWANSAFQTTAITVFLGPYLTALAESAADADGFFNVAGLSLRAAAYYPYLVSLSALLQVATMPLVGALTDRTGRRRALLGTLAAIGSVATMLLYFVRDDAWLLGGLLFLVATVAYTNSIVVYNAWLPDIADTDERDAVSSRGWALGYLGGGVLLAANLLLLQLASNGVLAIDVGEAVRISIVSAGGWWALFTLVPVAGLPDAPPRSLTATGFRQVAATLRRLRRAPATLMFLLAYLVFNDGVQTVISQSAVFADQELDLAQDVVVVAVLIVQLVAVVGALLLGRLALRLGAKRVVLASLVVWVVVLVSAYVLPAGRELAFYGLAAGIGLVLGGTQALSRSLFSHMIPSGAEAEYFSAYEISDRGTSWFGALLFGLALQVTDSYRIAVVSLVVFFVIGFVLLWRVDIRRAAAEAGNAAPARV